MSHPVGLERLPADVSELVGISASALERCATELDSAMVPRGHARLDAVAERRDACAAATSQLLDAVAASRRPGPDRSRLAALARSLDRTAESIESMAWAWARHPIPELTDLLRALRDATRAAARAAAAIEDEAGRLVWDARCRQHEGEARMLDRAARGALLGRQDDVRLATAAQDLLAYASVWLDAIAGARAAVLRFSLG